MKFHAKRVLGVLKPKKRARKSKRRSALALAKQKRGGEAEASIGRLPDVLISCIMSRLRTATDVASATAVCRRWNACTRYVTSLRLDTGDEDVEEWVRKGAAMGWIRMIHRSVGLRKLQITSSGYPWDFNREMFILMCIVHANSSLAVLDLDLGLTIRSRFLDIISKFGYLTGLHLSNTSDIAEFFPGSSNFPALRRCSMSGFRLSDPVLEEFVLQCPVLEELFVVDCIGLERPTITSKSLKSLTFKASEFADSEQEDVSEYDDDPGVSVLKVVAPELTFLSIEYVHEIVCNAARLRELEIRSRVVPRFKSLAALETLRTGWACWPHDMFQRLLSAASSARYVVLSNFSYTSIAPVVPLPAEDAFRTLTAVESLEIAGDYYRALVYSDESRRIIRFPKLKRLCVWMSFSNEVLLGFLLEASPVLEVLRVCVSQLDTSRHTMSYLRALLGLRLRYPRVVFDLEVPQTTAQFAHFKELDSP